MFDVTHRLGLWLVIVTALTLLASPALAVPQYTPTSTALLHTFGNGPGAAYNTAAPGDSVSFTQSTGELTISGVIDVLNYYDPGNGSCATDAGSNCAYNYAPDLTLQVSALLQSIVTTPIGGPVVQVDINFQTSTGTDITWSDPADGDSTQLAADWQAGTFQGTTTTGLVATTYYDTSTSTVVSGSGIKVAGFAVLDNAAPYASLFGSDPTNRIYLSIQDFGGLDLDALISAAVSSGQLTDFSAQVSGGQIFRVASGDFIVPEPTTALLLGLGLAGLGLAKRRQTR